MSKEKRKITLRKMDAEDYGQQAQYDEDEQMAQKMEE